MAASSSASAAARRVSAGVIGRDELDGEDVLARSPVAPMAAVPGARTVPAVRRRANAILDPTGRGHPTGDGPPIGRFDPNGTRLDEAARVAEARLHALHALEIERQLAPEEAAIGHVVADDPGQGERRESTRDLAPSPAGRGCERLDPEPRFPAEGTAHRGDRRSRRGVCEPVERTALAGEATPDSGLSTSVRRAPGTSSCQPVLPSPSAAKIRSDVA